MFPAHNGPISSIIIDDAGEYFITGSTDGVIKVSVVNVITSTQIENIVSIELQRPAPVLCVFLLRIL